MQSVGCSNLQTTSQVSRYPLVRVTLQRKSAKPRTRKEPITVEMLAKIVDSLGPAPSLSHIRLAASCLLAFAALLRYDDLANLRCCDITFAPSHMTIHIASSKMDQFCQGESVKVARTGKATCPVAMLERYVAAELLTSPELLLTPSEASHLHRQDSQNLQVMPECVSCSWKSWTSLVTTNNSLAYNSLRSGATLAAAKCRYPRQAF